MHIVKNVHEGCMVGVGDWMDVDILGRKPGIGVGVESDGLAFPIVADRGDIHGEKAPGIKILI